ncbi:ExbD/TolR family protein [Haloferula sp.]|uniref:ExbD/TolR family protein n=1 Tax=Haloferula sp. TaxID=2497595 RepID=UPI00329FCE2A
MKAIPLGSSSDAPKNPIASMVDIAFLLLIFFLVATTIKPVERDLLMKLPRPGNTEAVSREQAVVTLDQDGSILWGSGAAAMQVGSSGDMEPLREMLDVSVAAWGGEQPGLMLKVADDVDQQQFIEVLDTLAVCGVEKVALLE